MYKFIYSKSLTSDEYDWLIDGLHKHAYDAKSLSRIESFAIKVLSEERNNIAATAGIYVYGAL